MKLTRDVEEYRKSGPMSPKERKIISSILGYFVLLAALLIYFFFFSGVMY